MFKIVVNYSYEIIVGDVLGVCIYILVNGLCVYLSVNKNEFCIFINICFCVGLKYDFVDIIGLVYYMEYMLFKGISKIGIINWEVESKLLEQIVDFFEIYC